jgi:hypothetical protein
MLDLVVAGNRGTAALRASPLSHGSPPRLPVEERGSVPNGKNRKGRKARPRISHGTSDAFFSRRGPAGGPAEGARSIFDREEGEGGGGWPRARSGPRDGTQRSFDHTSRDARER